MEFIVSDSGSTSDPAMQAREGEGDACSSHMDSSSSKATTDSKEPVQKLRNVIVPLTEDRLIRNKKESKSVKPTRQCPFETYMYKEKCLRLEKENLEVKKKLKEMEKYSRECKAEVQRFVKRFREFKTISTNLDLKNKQLLIKNQQMRQRIEDVLKQGGPHSEERVSGCCERLSQENAQPGETIVARQEEVKSTREPVWESQKMQPVSELFKEKGILTPLQQENQIPREQLDHRSQVIKDQWELDELKRCLLTVQTERNLLRQEVNRLHEAIAQASRETTSEQ